MYSQFEHGGSEHVGSGPESDRSHRGVPCAQPPESEHHGSDEAEEQKEPNSVRGRVSNPMKAQLCRFLGTSADTNSKTVEVQEWSA